MPNILRTFVFFSKFLFFSSYNFIFLHKIVFYFMILIILFLFYENTERNAVKQLYNIDIVKLGKIMYLFVYLPVCLASDRQTFAI